MALGDGKRGGGRFDEPGHLPWQEAVEEQDFPTLEKGRRRFLLVVGALIVIALFGSLLLYVYNKGQEVGAGGRVNEPPLVLAPEGPTKVQPSDRGGMDVPDQDRLVFDRITGQDSTGNENLGNSPEQPVENPAGTGGQADTSGGQASGGETSGTTVPIQQPQESTSTPAQTQTQPSSQPATTAGGAVQPWKIQLGAFGSSRSTEIAWDQLQARFPAVLGDLSLEVEPLSRPGSPPLYRLRGSGYSSRAGADRACEVLRASGQGCFVVAPR